MNGLVYWMVRGMVRVLQALPLRLLARAGRLGGWLAWALDAKHRGLVQRNLRASFGAEKTEKEIRAIARETFMRIGENAVAAIRTAAMEKEEILKVCQVSGLESFQRFGVDGAPKNCIMAVGHFGNFELYTILGKLVPGLQPATTYRGMNHPALNAVVQRLREASGCLFFERRSEAAALKEALNKGGILLGLLADQALAKGGVHGTFFDRPCSTSPAPALFALRYDAPLFAAICYRVGLARWRIEVGEPIATTCGGEHRRAEEIMAEVNRAFEAAIRRDPANWFWVHDRWKRMKLKVSAAAGAAAPTEPASGPEREPAAP